MSIKYSTCQSNCQHVNQITTKLYYDQSMWIRLAHRLHSDFQYFFYRLEKLNLRRTLGERKMSDFPSGVWERGKSKGWNWVFRLLGIFWMWILPESATGTSKGFAPKINSVRFFIVKHTSLARPFWQSSSERNVFVIILTRSKTSVLLLTNRQRHNSLQCFTDSRGSICAKK